MSRILYLATDDGLVAGEVSNGEGRESYRALQGRRVTSVIAREGVILAGTTGGIFRSDDRALNWEEASDGLSIKHVRWLAYHPEVSDLALAGTEPAAIFVSNDGARTWEVRPEVGELRDANDWFLPYSPGAGCVRGFAALGERLYAAVEVGGLLRTDDRGANWKLVQGSDGVPRWGRPASGHIHPDVHSVAVHSTSADLVYAPTGGGFYFSEDGGRQWSSIYADCYCRAVWIDPEDPAHIVLGPADSVDRNGRIELTRDGGRSWHNLSDGSDMPWSNNMVERFQQVGPHLYAVLANGQLLTAVIGSWSWRRVFEDVPRVRDIASGRGE